ncbi:hypothetical protein NM208_g14335 [Fusarium decemcellulare]|uniref:Uncharacterized protein n=1 Tax=Fusarium decemcellulare TaxID=57161 RepID=A0ACC1RIA5_9HYPO|nr:hypothetical protein NM208_g14335 [Fusarium decemcellulare]
MLSSPEGQEHGAAMGKFKGRSAVACTACHSQKLKCSGGTPCNRCSLRNRECVYPKKEKYIAVPESYLREIEGEANLSRQSSAAEFSSSADTQSSFFTSDRPETTDYSPVNDNRTARSHLHEDCSAERFIQKLKDLSSTLHPFVQSDQCQPLGTGKESGYTYLRLNSDFHQPEVSVKLPPKPYALHLLDIFEEIFCDYHWFLRRDFRERLCLTYSHPMSQSGDRNWFCRVSVVLALAQTFVYSEAPASPEADRPMSSSEGAESTKTTTLLPPGSDLFEQAVLLFKTSSEEPVLEDIEALNLMAFYCYSLNRRKTAFIYASQSITLSKLLHLDKSQPYQSKHSVAQTTNYQRVNSEHMRRLWWTSYCMDRMVATELGLSPTQWNTPQGVPLPSSADLMPEDLCQFFDPAILAAQIQLCEIKRRVADTVAGLLRTPDYHSILHAIQPCLELLQNWKESLPCFTVLLRPFFLQELSGIMQERLGKPTQSMTTASEQIQGIKIQSLEAARNNCIILLDLSTHCKIAKFGYWDSIHIFSALAILSLSNIPSIDPRGPKSDADGRLYTDSRAILEDMARSGNPSAKDHESLLTDVEAMVKEVSSRADQPMVDPDATITDPWDLQPSFGDLGFYELISDQLWWDIDWSNLSNTYGEGLGSF